MLYFTVYPLAQSIRRRSGEDPAQTMDEGLDRDAFAERYGADPADIEAIEDFASDHGLDVVQSSIPRRTVVLSGTIAEMSKAFGAELGLYAGRGLFYFTSPSNIHRQPEGPTAFVANILGSRLDPRGSAREDSHVPARARQMAHDLAPNTRAAPSHNGNLGHP